MKKIVCFLLISLSLLTFPYLVLARAAENRPLEITYPQIPNVLTPTTVGTWLPDYINYIFRFAIVFSGVVIFGTFIYSGIQYLISGISPVKLAEAKAGMVASIFGIGILLAAYLIFNTINPQLTILELPELAYLAGVATPGVYICSYDADLEVPNIEEQGEYGTYKFTSLQDLLSAFIAEGPIPVNIEERNKQTEKQISATKILKRIMYIDDNKRCYRVPASGDSLFTIFSNYSMFIIPRVVIKPTGSTPPTKREAIYEYGIVLHEKPGQRGKCQLYPEPENGKLYPGKPFYKTNLTSISYADSFTLFRKPVQEPPAGTSGVNLYHCLQYNQNPETNCPEASRPVAQSNPRGNLFSPRANDDIGKFFQSDLGRYIHEGLLSLGTRSVRIYPRGSYFAIFFKEDNFQDNCEIIKTSHPFLLSAVNEGCPARNCGVIGVIANFFKSLLYNRFLREWETCVPCLKSMYVIKGEVL